MKKKITVLVAGMALLFAPIQASYAVVQPKSHLSQEDQAVVRANLTNLGVDQKTQDKLIKKLKDGQILDSENPAKVKEVEHEMILTKPGDVKRHVFDDGSVLQTSLSGGTTSCGTGYCMYDNVTVGRYTSTMTAQFYASYTITQGKSYPDNIRSVYNPYVSGVGDFSNISLTLTIPDEYIGTSSYAAEAAMTFDVRIGLDGVSYTNKDWLKLYVGGDSAWQGANF